jgi:hypothetical protein
MPDGKAYRGMRGGNWYNGLSVNGIIDGHSRVSNRNPSYYRGPQDPNHPYYHLGFRVVRNSSGTATAINSLENNSSDGIKLYPNYPNPFSQCTTIQFSLPKSAMVNLKVLNAQGQTMKILINSKLEQGMHSCTWNADQNAPGLFFILLQTEGQMLTKNMILTK